MHGTYTLSCINSVYMHAEIKYRYLILVTLRATGNYEIKGFMCQVRKADGTDATAIGKFTAFEPASKGKYLACTSSKVSKQIYH